MTGEPRNFRDERLRAIYAPLLPPPAAHEPGEWDDEPLDISVWSLIGGYLGLTLHGVMAYFPFIFTLWIAPLPVILGLYAAWFILLRLAVRYREAHPGLVFALPVVEAVAWVAMVYLGQTYLGWPAVAFPENR